MAKPPPPPKGTSAKAQHLFAQGLALHQNGQLEEAAALYKQTLHASPEHLDALHFLGIIYAQEKQYDQAIALFDRAIAANPNSSAVHGSRGIALKELKRFDEAIASYDRTIALSPNDTNTYYNRGIALSEFKRFDEAVASYDKAIALKPDYAGAHLNRGFALNEIKRFNEAIASYDRAIALKPDYAEAYANRGIILNELNHFAEALASYNKAIAYRPDYAKAYSCRGVTLTQLNRLSEALSDCSKAIALNPDYADAYYNRGTTLKELRRLDQALVDYETARALEPDYEFLFGTVLHIKMQLCDWMGLAQSLAHYEQGIRSSVKITTPFAALSLVDSPILHKAAAQLYANAKYPKRHPLAAHPPPAKNDRIRIGYFSADFRNHPTGYLTGGLFECRDASRFELHGFYFGPDKQDETRNRISSAFDEFYDVRDKSDEEVARHARALGIDIAVDLMGHTTEGRMGIFAERCAPIQASYLGYPGTSGADYIDYILADTTVIPKDRQSDFTEAVVYLANSYQVNDSQRKISQKAFTRQELGLPDSGFVFCCFNNSYKILPTTFDSWMRLLKAVEGSVLWLLEANPTATENLRREAEQRDVDSASLVFAKPMPLDEHLARHRLADLFIDTLPYNAHTTASDALWAGLPVLTCMGQSFASRVAASLLKAIDLPELITQSLAEYEALAIELAHNAEKLRAIGQKLERNRLTTPLFDTKLFAKNVEAAYVAMYERYRSGLAPQTIECGF